MKKPVLSIAIALIFSAATVHAATHNEGPAIPTSEPFSSKIVTTDLDAPWDMVWGPDNMIWLTERQGKKITRVNPETGEKKPVITIDDVFVGPQHEGVLGLALSPDFMKSGKDNHVYVSYTYKNGEDEHAKIVRYSYDADKQALSEPTVVIEGLPAGNDHNGGRLRFGPDGKLYYTIGEQGHNQGANYCQPIEAQRLPTADEVSSKNWAAYRGKVLRLNADGSVPDDNPVLNSVKSHVFTYGHRNPQGLVFANGHLFSSEQGPSSDDEINILESGGNYGWPHVAGFKDDQAYVYANWSEAANCSGLTYDGISPPKEVPQYKETSWNADNFKEPAKTLYTVPNGYNFKDEQCGDMAYLCWPTIAPASITYYPKDGEIKAWRNSLLVSSLKNGALYRLVLNADGKTIQGDAIKYFHSQNRYRMVLISPDSKTIYVATDTAGNVLDKDGKPANKMANPGAIIAFTYTE